MDCTCHGRGARRLRPRSASRNDTCDDDGVRAGTRGTGARTRSGTRATLTSEDCAGYGNRANHDAAARRITGVERLLQDRVTRQLPARLRKTGEMLSIEKCRLWDSSAGDCIQSVHELERSTRPRGKKSSRSTVRPCGGDRQSGDTWHSRGQLRERDLSKVPHVLSALLFAGQASMR
jgi:hypothetical protein